MQLPASTYRIQFNSGFRFSGLKKITDYLIELGIGAVYASPVFSSVPGSNHGYDVIDPNKINPEIGSLDELITRISFLKKNKIDWIQDIVPNHMAFHTGNEWLMDVLKKGRDSSYASWFDIDWDHPGFKGKIMVPFLGKPLEACINEGEIKIAADEHGELIISYYENIFPVNIQSLQFLRDLYSSVEPGKWVAGLNSDPSAMFTFLSEQFYVLSPWYDTSEQINYRRFFTINGLISLKMENYNVFRDYHKLIFKLAEENYFTGLRIDHVDGLKLPETYFNSLRLHLGSEIFMVAEKILQSHEDLPEHWPVQGTTGYEFLAILNNIFTNLHSMPMLKGFYKEITSDGNEIPVESVILNNKNLVLNESFAGDLANICRMVDDPGLVTYNHEITPEKIREAIGLLLVLCPVYKLYSTSLPLNGSDKDTMADIIAVASEMKPYLKNTLRVLQNLFFDPPDELKNRVSEFFMRLMQYTGPLMAKGLEDTTMYSWSCFLAHNEVGDYPDSEGIKISSFHSYMEKRRREWPASLNTTATHDTKRGEDSRARLFVISDIPDEWFSFIRSSVSWNESKKGWVENDYVPDNNEEYFIYQALLGSMPVSCEPDENYALRFCEYMEKVLREAKVHSSWNKPDPAYENAVKNFVTALLNDKSYLKKIVNPFFRIIREFGIINSLSQLVLKFTCPGIPDFYQGTEFWDLSFVDPDNRRQLDYSERHESLREIKRIKGKSGIDFLENLYDHASDGKIKLWLSHCLFKMRFLERDSFVFADYIPLRVTGEYRDNWMAFVRKTKNTWFLVIIPLHLAENDSIRNRKPFSWNDTAIQLPENAPVDWVLLWNDRKYYFYNELWIDQIYTIPVPLVFKGIQRSNGRAGGVLLHLTSLAGGYGSGNLGTEAHRFIDFLVKSGLQYWQILPFNPVDRSGSPYSSSSAFAGGIHLIDPDSVVNRFGLKNIPKTATSTGKVDFEKAYLTIKSVLSDAFRVYNTQDNPASRKEFTSFCEKNSYWLNDFVLFTALSDHFKGEPWVNWPEKLRNRETAALKAFSVDHNEEIDLLKFSQYIFDNQFKALAMYAESFDTRLIGDISFYVSFNSADVWAHRDLFDIDMDGNMISMAGVPPDFFSKTGQLWNMPVYNWKKMKAKHFEWWKKRIERNLEFCSIIRLDHFRGFSSFWKVPAGEKTAVRGKWVKGPAEDFFSEMKASFPGMPFIAEDLGDIDDDVIQLRDRFNLPGMRVLQFAFDEKMVVSDHIPHQYKPECIVYTGTHDNNTIKGWFSDSSREIRNRLSAYSGRKVTQKSVCSDLIQMAFASVAKTAIIPMQDLLELDGTSRLNTPGKARGNWKWRMKPDVLTNKLIEKLHHLSAIYGRI
ncbi:MAG TPA: malto-oligosyltrehalose synthase [Bacteroidales bacterium]|nr:malto-oligosyltrehalose synthase [Bacteroidales bacterium]